MRGGRPSAGGFFFYPRGCSCQEGEIIDELNNTEISRILAKREYVAYYRDRNSPLIERQAFEMWTCLLTVVYIEDLLQTMPKEKMTTLIEYALKLKLTNCYNAYIMLAAFFGKNEDYIKYFNLENRKAVRKKLSRKDQKELDALCSRMDFHCITYDKKVFAAHWLEKFKNR